MRKIFFLFIALSFTPLVEAQPGSQAIPYGNNKEVGNFISMDGVNIYYEIYGKGAPLVLIHGNGGNIADRKQADAMIAKKDTSQNWKVLQQRNRLMEFQPHISADDLHKIKCPVLVLSTDRDIVREEHTLYIYRNISRANLCIFTGEDHYVTKNNPDLFNATVAKYFN